MGEYADMHIDYLMEQWIRCNGFYDPFNDEYYEDDHTGDVLQEMMKPREDPQTRALRLFNNHRDTLKWHTMDKKEIYLKNMTDFHVTNAIAYLQRQNKISDHTATMIELLRLEQEQRKQDSNIFNI